MGLPQTSCFSDRGLSLPLSSVCMRSRVLSLHPIKNGTSYLGLWGFFKLPVDCRLVEWRAIQCSTPRTNAVMAHMNRTVLGIVAKPAKEISR